MCTFITVTLYCKHVRGKKNERLNAKRTEIRTHNAIDFKDEITSSVLKFCTTVDFKTQVLGIPTHILYKYYLNW